VHAVVDEELIRSRDPIEVSPLGWIVGGHQVSAHRVRQVFRNRLVIGAEMGEHLVHLIDLAGGHQIGDHGVGERVSLEFQGFHGEHIRHGAAILRVRRWTTVQRGERSNTITHQGESPDNPTHPAYESTSAVPPLR
jgi:hypothetical protein